MSTIMLKICPCCHRTLDFSNFSKDAGKSDGLYFYCRGCQKERARKYYENNKDRCNERKKLYYKLNKDRIRAYSTKYNLEHKAEIKEYQRIYYLSHRDTIIAQATAYNRKKKLRE